MLNSLSLFFFVLKFVHSFPDATLSVSILNRAPYIVQMNKKGRIKRCETHALTHPTNISMWMEQQQNKLFNEFTIWRAQRNWRNKRDSHSTNTLKWQSQIYSELRVWWKQKHNFYTKRFFFGVRLVLTTVIWKLMLMINLTRNERKKNTQLHMLRVIAKTLNETKYVAITTISWWLSYYVQWKKKLDFDWKIWTNVAMMRSGYAN